ncbi:hypothetical protein [Motiliproteus sediminis]|uniref:hypothetical protein n=1 Tax=Motiliproteus sediminis TaxID=1468178 RepID=UPI001AEF7233|nr:hypothetical protein [Motiliproteus sediminis]
MIIDIPRDHKAADLMAAAEQAAPGADLQCHLERQYAILKIALLKLQRDDLSLSLMDGRGAISRQVTARKRADTVDESGMTQTQRLALQALEKAFQRCRAQGLLVVGFSDSLVAVPEALGCGAEVLSTPSAVELDTHDAYHGFEDGME